MTDTALNVIDRSGLGPRLRQVLAAAEDSKKIKGERITRQFSFNPKQKEHHHAD